MAVPYTFGSATTSIPLSQLDSNFATTITLGNTAIQLGNTVTTLNNMTLANVTISSGTSNISSTSIANGTSNVTIASSGGAVSMATNGTTAVTIDTAGRIQVAGTTVVDSGRISVTFDSANSTGVSIKASAAAGGTISQYWNSSNTSMGSIACNGTTVTYNSVSDYRLKENITPMTGALAKVLLLKPVTYKWKANGSNGQGFIAHELQDVVPDCVTGEKDAVDSEGNPKYQQVDTSFLVATLTAAIQELKTIVDAQAAEIAELKTKGA